jgi:glycerol-3-phosphate acyltransferase PlsY
MRDYILIAIIAYLCGSIPFGYLLVRLFKGKDIRESGSGNIGATNVARTSPALGIATLLLVGLKGYLPVKGALLIGISYDAEVKMYGLLLALAIVFVVAGHMFPVWLRFRGGKGVATAVGAYLSLVPLAVAVAALVFLIVLAASRFVSLASIIAALAFPAIAYWQLGGVNLPFGWPFYCSLIGVSALIIAKHRANIGRLLNGTENRFGKKRAEEQIVAED